MQAPSKNKLDEPHNEINNNNSNEDNSEQNQTRDNARRECFVYDTEPETTFMIRILSDQSIEA